MPPQPPHRKSYTYGSVLGKPGGALTAEPRAYSRDQLRSLPSLENNYKMSQSMRAFIHERSLMEAESFELDSPRTCKLE